MILRPARLARAYLALAAAAALRPAPRTRSKTSLQASSNPAADELWVPTTAEDILWTPSSRDSSRDDAFGPLSDPLLDGRAKYCESLEAFWRPTDGDGRARQTALTTRSCGRPWARRRREM